MAKILMSNDSGTIKVGTLIALLAEDGEDWKSVTAPESGSSSSSNAAAEETSSAPSGGSTPGHEVKMPSLSPTMTEGTIVKWCKQEGDKIEPGDVLCEIQTDKAVVSMEYDDEAILAKILIPEGQAGVQVYMMIAFICQSCH